MESSGQIHNERREVVSSSGAGAEEMVLGQSQSACENVTTVGAGITSFLKFVCVVFPLTSAGKPSTGSSTPESSARDKMHVPNLISLHSIQDLLGFFQAYQP